MRVGIFTEGQSDLGGTWQLGSGILHALDKGASESRHKFYLLSTSPYQEKYPIPLLNIPVIHLITGIYRYLYLIFDKVMKFCSRFGFRVFNLVPLFVRPMQKVLKKNGIQVLYFLKRESLSYRLDFPYILTVYDLQFRTQPEFPEISLNGKWRKLESVFGRAIPRASAIIVDSQVGKEDVCRIYSVTEDRVFVLPYFPASFTFLEDEAGGIEVVNKYNLPIPYLFYPAQFWPHKNHSNLLISLKKLKNESDLLLPLVLVGSDKGNLSYVMELAAQLGLEGQVYYLGFVPDKDMVSLYRHALALVFPTFFGPTNIPPLEAFALGCPALVSDIPGMREQVGDAALLFDPKDPCSIANAILKIYQDKSIRDDLVWRGKKRLGHWGPDRYVQCLLSILDQLEPRVRCWSWIE